MYFMLHITVMVLLKNAKKTLIEFARKLKHCSHTVIDNRIIFYRLLLCINEGEIIGFLMKKINFSDLWNLK